MNAERPPAFADAGAGLAIGADLGAELSPVFVLPKLLIAMIEILSLE